MTPNLSPVISEIVSMYGVSVLDDAKRVKALFADLARDVGKPQKAAFLACLEHGFAGALKNARGSTYDIAACKTELARRLYEEEGFDAALCGEAVETLAGAVAAPSKTKAAHIPPVQTPPQTPNAENQQTTAPPQNTALSFFTGAKAVFILRILAAALLFIGIAKQPYSYYKMLRLVITIIALLNAAARIPAANYAIKS